MMKCDKVKEILSESGDIQASKRKKNAVKLHLEKCQACQAWLKEHQAFEECLTKSLNDILAQVEMPTDLFLKVKYKISKIDENPGKRIHSEQTFFQWVRSFIPQIAFRFVSILISILLLHDIIRGILNKV